MSDDMLTALQRAVNSDVLLPLLCKHGFITGAISEDDRAAVAAVQSGLRESIAAAFHSRRAS